MGTNNWLQSTVTNYKRQGIHPFRHLLLLYFFNQDIDSFLKVKRMRDLLEKDHGRV